MDKATLLMAAASTLRRKLRLRLADAVDLWKLIFEALAKAALFTSAMFAWVALGAEALLTLLPLLPRLDSPGWGEFQAKLLRSHPDMDPRGWSLFAAFELAACAAAILLTFRDPGLAVSNPLPPKGIARLNAILMRPWAFFDAALKAPSGSGSLRSYPSMMAKILLHGASLPLQAAILAWATPCSWAFKLAAGAAALARSGPAAAEALQRLAHESPEVIAKREAKTLGAHAGEGKGQDAPPRL